jgi:hypothetical protein
VIGSGGRAMPISRFRTAEIERASELPHRPASASTHSLCSGAAGAGAVAFLLFLTRLGRSLQRAVVRLFVLSFAPPSASLHSSSSFVCTRSRRVAILFATLVGIPHTSKISGRSLYRSITIEITSLSASASPPLIPSLRRAFCPHSFFFFGTSL